MNVFEQIYWVFAILGTLVGIVVIGYMLYNAYKYRDEGDDGADADRPQLGELPTGGGKGRKLFLSFGLSAVVVISLIVWTYGTLLYVENAAAQDGNNIETEGDEVLDVTVVGYRFGWNFVYEGGNETFSIGDRTWENVTVIGDDEDGVLRLPAGQKVRLTVISQDVFHNFGIPELRVKSDAIPGQTTDTWVEAEEGGNTYTAKCYELCGAQHSYMVAQVETMSPTAFEDWYEGATGTNVSTGGA